MKKNKFDKRIVEQIRDNVKGKERVVSSYFKEFDCKMQVAESIDDVMKAKKELLSNLTYSFPVAGTHCYFCLIDYRCLHCSYGKAHGKCSGNNGEANTWWKILEKIKDLRSCIDEEYWTGEELKEEVAKNEKRGQSVHRVQLRPRIEKKSSEDS